MSVLYISPEEFYALSPVEFYYAMRSYNEVKQNDLIHDMRTRFEVARLQAVLLVNHQIGRPRSHMYDSVEQFYKFAWDEKKAVQVQTIEEQKKAAMKIALALGAKESNRKPDDPPTHLAPKFRT